jgi:hypothetical protein
VSSSKPHRFIVRAERPNIRSGPQLRLEWNAQSHPSGHSAARTELDVGRLASIVGRLCLTEYSSRGLHVVMPKVVTCVPPPGARSFFCTHVAGVSRSVASNRLAARSLDLKSLPPQRQRFRNYSDLRALR